MGINFSALNKGPGREQAVHPRDIFNALPNKPRGMDYLRARKTRFWTSGGSGGPPGTSSSR